MTIPQVPLTIDAAISPAFLSAALGRNIARSEVVEVIRTVATKVRFKAFPEAGGEPLALCIKGLLDVDEMTARGGTTMVREASFYDIVAPAVDVRVPGHVVNVIDRTGQQAVVIMNDVIAAGGRFCSAAEPFTAEQASTSLSQLARLHCGHGLLASNPWITRRVAELANSGYVTPVQLQELLDGPRGDPLDPATRNAARLIAAMRALAERDAQRPQFLVHGDAHAGNIFRDAGGGTGLIDWQLLQRGGWALDVAYHIAAVLPVELAEREERALLGHYIEDMRSLGQTVPDAEEAWRQYREALVYGYYLWSITRRVEPRTIELFVARLGGAVSRHGSFALLGVA